MEKRYSVWRVLKKGWLTILVLALVFAGIGATYSYNCLKNTYYFAFSYKEDIDISIEEIVSKENIDKVKKVTTSYYTGSTISSYSKVNLSPKHMKITEQDNVYSIVLDSVGFSSVSNIDTTVKGFLKHLVIMPLDDTLYEDYQKTKVVNNEEKTVTIKGVSSVFDDKTLSFSHNDRESKMLAVSSSIGLGIGVVLGLALVLALGYKYKDSLEKESIHDNDTIFRTPFHKKFWSLSCKELKNTRKLVIMAILLALTLCAKYIPIPSGFGNLGLGLGFIFLGIGAVLLGPVPALIMGASSDILGFFLNNGGFPFHYAYVIQAMLACFAYGIFLYRTKISFTRVLLARIVVNFIANVIIGSLAWADISNFTASQTMNYILAISLPKNMAYLIPQSILLYVAIRCIIPIADLTNYVEPKIAENMAVF